VIEPENISPVIKQILEHAGRNISWSINLLGVVMGLLVGLFGALIIFLQLHASRKIREEFQETKDYFENKIALEVKLADFKGLKDRIEQELNEFKKDINAQLLHSLDAQHHKLREEVNRIDDATNDRLSGIPDEVNQRVSSLFDQQYRIEIVRITRAFAEEVLMVSPEARDLLLARLARLDLEIKEVLEPCLGEECASQLFKVIGKAIQDWHTLQQLHSPDEEQLQAGLQTLIAEPFQEAHRRLLRLKRRYELEDSKSSLFLTIKDGIDFLEKESLLSR